MVTAVCNTTKHTARRIGTHSGLLLVITVAGLSLAGCSGVVSHSQASNPAPVAPTIMTQPASQTVTAGQAATFGVAATGTAPLSYQWRKNSTAISGATSSSYTTPATASSDNGAQFTVVASNTAGSVTSNIATLTVSSSTTSPSVPTGLSALAASSAQINLTWSASTGGSGGVAGYKVYRGGSQIATAPSTSYSDIGLAASTSYTYNVAAYDAAGNTSAQSAGASATTLASSGGGGGLPTSLGWYQIPNTTIQAVAPSASTYPEIQGNEGPSAVVADWSGALEDTKRSAMIIWGGGHSGYFGNELYSLNLTANPISLTRITTPSHGSAVTGAPSCPEAYTDGLPAARHTYNGLWHLANQDTYYMAGAGLPGCGSFSNAIWSFDPTTLAWKNLNTAPGPHPAQNGSVPQQAYDSVTGLVYEVEANTGIFWSYSPTTNAWTSLANVTGCYKLNATTVIDPGRRLYFCIGNGGFWKVSLNSPYTITDIQTASGCSALISASGPGFDYDPLQKVLVGWAGGNTVYVYNPDTNNCTAQTYPNGPSTPQANGTYGRWKFFPSVGVFALVNAWDQNAWALRIDAVSGSGGTALQDFQSRCAASGVIVCEGFDSASEFVHATSPNTGLYSNSGNIGIVQDTSVYASGGGSLKFPIKANAGQGASVLDNNWLQTFCSAHPPNACTPTVFQQNSDFYIQFRYRVDSNYVNTNWELPQNGGSSPKIADIAHHSSSCGQTELTLNNRGGTAMPMMYGACGGYGMYVQTGTTLENQNTPYNFQSDYYNCQYPQTPHPPGGCFTMPANTWMTFYEHIHIGTYNQPNSIVEVWVSTGYTDALKYLIHITNFTMPPPDGGPITGYDAIWFNVYMTGFLSTATNPAANVWLDEVIVSTQPIAAPNTAPAVP